MQTPLPPNPQIPEPFIPNSLAPALLSAYGFSFLSQLCDLLFYIVLFKFLPLAGVGRFSWVMAVMVFVGLVLDMGISPALTREFSQHETSLWPVFWQSSRIRFPGFVLSLLLFAGWVLLRRPQFGLGAAVLLAGLQQVLHAFNTVFAAWLYAAERQPLANLVSAVFSAGRLCVSVGLLVVAGSTNVALLFAALVAVEAFGLGLAWALSQRVAPGSKARSQQLDAECGELPGLRSRLKAVGLSFGAITVLAAVQNRLDWLLVSYFLSVEALALYSMANKWYEVANNLVTLALSSAFPWMCREGGQCGPGMRVYFKCVLAGSALIGLGGAVAGPEVLSLIWGQKYAGSETAIRLLMLGTIPATFGAIVYRFLIADGSERFIVWVSAVATFIQVGLDVLLIPRWGIQGAVAGMLALVVAVAVLYAYGARHQLEALGRYWALFPLLLAGGGFFIIWSHLVLWGRAALGLCLWVLTSGYPVYREGTAVFQSIGPKLGLANGQGVR